MNDGLQLGEVGEEVGMVFDEASQVVVCEGYALDEVGLAFEEAAIAVGAEGLEDAQEDIVPEMVHEMGVAVERDIVLQQLVAQGLGQVALGAEEERGDIVLCGAASSALVVDVEQLRIFRWI